MRPKTQYATTLEKINTQLAESHSKQFSETNKITKPFTLRLKDFAKLIKPSFY